MSEQIFIEEAFLKEFNESKEYVRNEESIKFQKDLFRMYDFDFDEESLKRGKQNKYIDMCEKLIDELPKGYISDFDVFILAYDTPDLQPHQSVISYLTDKYNIKGLCFALSDYGNNIGIGALQVAVEIIRFTSKMKKALIIVLDQNTIPIKQNSVFTDVGALFVLNKNSVGNPKIEGHQFAYFDERPTIAQIKKQFKINDSNLQLYCSLHEDRKYRTSDIVYTYARDFKNINTAKKICLVGYDPYLKKVDLLKLETS